MSGWRLEKKSQTAYRFKKKEGRALVALLSFLCNRNEVSYYIKKGIRSFLRMPLYLFLLFPAQLEFLYLRIKLIRYNDIVM